MSSHTLLSVSAASFAVLAFATLTQCDGKKPYAGDVTVDKGVVSGTFEFMDWPTAWGGVTNDGRGGACMLVSLRDLGYPEVQCHMGADHKVSECGPWPQGWLWRRWYGYCDLDENAAPGTVGQCWGRPTGLNPEEDQAKTETWCNRSIDYDPMKLWPSGTSEPANKTPPLQLSSVPVVKRPSHWRVVACLKPSDTCVYGKIAEVP